MLKNTLMGNLDKYYKFRNSLGYSMDSYSNCYLEEYCNFCIKTYGECETLSKEILDSWLKIRIFKKSKTQSNVISLIRGFSKFLNSIGIESYIPDNDYSVKYQQFIPLIYKNDELKRIFEAIDSLKPTIYSPNKAEVLPVLFRMIYCCGLRPGEALKLKHDDINLITGDIYIRKTKNNKDRHIMMSQDLLELCNKYELLVGTRTYFFCKNKTDPFSSHWLQFQLKQAIEISGLHFSQKPRVYDFRHNFATRNMMNWIDQRKDIYSLLPVLSAYMGHEKITHTLYYIHLMPERLLKSAGINWEKLNSLYKD